MTRPPSYLKGVLSILGIAAFLSLISMSDTWGLVAVIAVIAAGGLLLLCSLGLQLKNAIIHPAHRLYAKDFSLKFMATLMGFFLMAGTGLYLYVLYTIGHDRIVLEQTGHNVEFTNVEYLLRALIYSLDLFMLDVDGSIFDRLDGHAGLKAWISIQAVLSFSCTVAVLISLVYSRLVAYFHLAYRTRIDRGRNHLYLFFGVNDPSRLLVKDIVRKDPAAIAILIDEANIKEDDNDEWEGIVGLLTHKQKVFTTADGIGACVAIAGQQLADIDSEITSRPDFDAFGYLGLPRVKKLIDSLSGTDGAELHIFFMDEDEERNIRNIIALAKDTTILSVADHGVVKQRIYCHARYNGPNRVIQDVALKKKLDIRLVDSSHIAVELLKHDPALHPVHVAGVIDKNPATVDTPLKTLIIGFGEVGRDAFRFLYEFGAFVDSSSTDTKAERSPFYCTVVDRDLDRIEGVMRAAMPAVFGREDGCLNFEATDVNHSDFYDRILTEEYCRKLNYVIISIGDNDEAISLGCRIFNRVRRFRERLDNLRILVRCTDDAKVEGVQKIADHYNYGYGDGPGNTPVIRVFGQPEHTYTYDLVVSDRLTQYGKKFHENYRRLKGEGDGWDKRHKSLTETGVPNIDKLRKLRRQESQDLANAFHAGTKMALLRKAMGPDTDWTMFYIRYFRADGQANVEGKGTGIHYPGLDDRENRIILRLAMLEHLRWNAAHELLGYRFNDTGGSCDERTMRHNCLCPWDMLDEAGRKADWPCDYKAYDFCVVDTTLAMAREHLGNQDSE